MSNKLEANESDSLLSAALSDAYRKRDAVDVWDDDALREFRKDYPKADVVPIAVVELMESRIVGLQREIVNRNKRALEGDKYKEAFDREYARAEKAEAALAQAEALLNTPETLDFLDGVRCEAAHQIQRWGYAHDRSKSAENWYWLVGYLAGKALRSAITGDREKALHHTAAMLAAMHYEQKTIRPMFIPLEKP